MVELEQDEGRERQREQHVDPEDRERRRERVEAQEELERRKRAPARAASRASRPWWRRPLLVVGVLLGVLIAWFTSLVVALNMLAF